MTTKKLQSYSWSTMDLFDKCPMAFKLSKLDGIPRVPSAALEVGRVVHELAERYLNLLISKGLKTDWDWAEKAAPADSLSDVHEVWDRFWQAFVLPDIQDPGVERRLAFDRKWKPCGWTAKSVRFRALIDFYYRQEDLGVIQDWKTGWAVPKTLEKDLQTRIYGWGAHAVIYPDLDLILLRHHYMRFNRDVEVLLEPGDLAGVPDEVEDRIRRIEAEKDFEPTPGNFCSWCGLQDHCPVMAKALVPAEVRVLVNKEQAEKAAELLLAVREMEKTITARLRDWVKENGPVQAGDLVFGPSERNTLDMDAKAVVELLLAEGLEREAVWPLLGVTKTKLTAGLRKLKRLDLLARAIATGTVKTSTRIDFSKAAGE